MESAEGKPDTLTLWDKDVLTVHEAHPWTSTGNTHHKEIKILCDGSKLETSS